MEKLINEAIAQLSNNGQVICRIYQDRDYNDSCDIICKSFEDAYELISHTYSSMNDDISIVKF